MQKIAPQISELAVSHTLRDFFRELRRLPLFLPERGKARERFKRERKPVHELGSQKKKKKIITS
jgi:hypothetical protein